MCGAGSGKDSGSSSPQVDKESLRAGDLEKYAAHLRQVMEAADWPWPENVLLDPAKQPRFIHSVEELIHELMVGCHMDEIVVFPRALEVLGQANAMGQDVAKAMGYIDFTVPPRANTAYDFLSQMDAEARERVKGKVLYRANMEDRAAIAAGGRKNACLAEKWQALESECPENAKESVYIAEMRQLQSELCDDGLRTKRKSTMQLTIRERMHKLGMQVRAVPFWDDFSEGFFCGAGCSSYDLHVDCIPSSNVGSVFAGHKLLAIWSYQDDTKAVMKTHGRQHFAKPLSGSQVKALEGTCCVGLAPPGSIYIFSGCNAHAVCNVGFSLPGPDRPPIPSLVASSYEAFVNLNLRHLEAVANTLDPFYEDSDSDEDLEDFADEIGEGAGELQKRLRKGEISEKEAAKAALEFLRSRVSRSRRYLKDRDSECSSSPEPKRQKRSGGDSIDGSTRATSSDEASGQ